MLVREEVEAMQERICPSCDRPCYSAAETEVWTCPRCGAVITPPVDPDADDLVERKGTNANSFSDRLA